MKLKIKSDRLILVTLNRDHNKNFSAHEPEAEYLNGYAINPTSKNQYPI